MAKELAWTKICILEKFDDSSAKSTSRIEDSAAVTLTRVTEMLEMVEVNWFWTEPRSERVLSRLLRAESAKAIPSWAPAWEVTSMSVKRDLLTPDKEVVAEAPELAVAVAPKYDPEITTELALSVIDSDR